ncbi:Probable galactinol--sucrose galactosyltransferase [Seminavis robusta]|uniref:galactinol--sucrose galactosyltransferase n=1 Tax=Seminavis robusta TaxID=568900 RepID=A0A9N8E8W1_9STRA|nr:Probable galactinol--sucrose galactosyltransferase [Seminavis robusta]|eukprot:Sro623_g177130.1 Probable galactinol--sucrose galactosyltransferase (842) ;mRNA; f:20226-22751
MMATSSSVTSDDDSVVLLTGTYGNLSKFSLVHQPTTTLRPGEEAAVFVRVLSPQTVQLGKTTDPLCAIHRFKIWWCRPVFQRPVPPETLLLLELIQDQYRLVLPVVLPLNNHHHKSFASSSLRGSYVGQREELLLYSNHKETGLYVGIGKDPYALIQEGVSLATQLWNSPTTSFSSSTLHDRTQRNNVILEKLGWCSWNACYTNVTGPKLVQAVRALQQDHGAPIQWMIVDDGWQHITTPSEAADKADGFQWSQRLQSYREDPVKFANLSLQETVQQLKRDLGIQSVWVWHTLAGYWLGVNPKSGSFQEQAAIHYPHFPTGIIDSDASASVEASVEKGIGIPNDADDFFRRYHTDFLAGDCQVDGVKVDAQGVIGILQASRADDGAENNNESAQPKERDAPVFRLHDAIATSALANFVAASSHRTSGETDIPPKQPTNPSILHCMAHAPEIFYRFPTLYGGKGVPFFRAADDFYPDNPHSHGPQIVACAYNSLLFQHVAIPDWDMFATGPEIGEDILQCHAIARCISGGPIYFSSSPEKMERGRPKWMDWICCPNGTTLPCRGTALPLPNCLLQDPLASNAEPLVLWNTNGGGFAHDEQSDDGERETTTSGIFGLFHFAAGGTWDYSKLTYVSNDRMAGTDLEEDGGADVELSPALIPVFAAHRYAGMSFLATSFVAHTVEILPSPGAAMSIRLQRSQSNALTVYPIHQVSCGVGTVDFVALGWEGRINAGGAVKDIQVNPDGAVEMSVLGCGDFLMALRVNGKEPSQSWLEKAVFSVFVDGAVAEYNTICIIASEEAAISHKAVPSSKLQTNLLQRGFLPVVVAMAPLDSHHQITIKFEN